MKLPRLGDFSFKDVNRRLLGAVAVVVTIAMLAIVAAVGSSGLLKPTYPMSGVFTDSAGLKKGDLVRMAGVEVGAVTGVHPDFQRGQVIITWKVHKGVPLGPNTSAEVVLATLLGGQYIRLSGPIERPYLASLPAAQRRIPLERTRLPATVSQVLNTATRLIQALDTTSVNQLLAQLSQVTADNQANFGPLLVNLAAVSNAINQRDQQLRQLVANTQQITGTLAAKDQLLPQLIDNAAVLLNTIITRKDQLATLLGSGSQSVTMLSNLISDHRAQLDAILGDLHVALGAVGRQLPQINNGLAWAGPAFAGVNTAAQQGPWVDVVVQQLMLVSPLINILTNILHGKAP
jgi:phospholipid/cholesterol/gamma-HCH transport system substrate-binding protein